MRLRLIPMLLGLGVMAPHALAAAPDNAVPTTWPKRLVLDDSSYIFGTAWIDRQLPQAHPLLVGRIQIDVSDEYQGDFATEKVSAASGGKPLLVFPPDQFVHDALRSASRLWFVPDDRCTKVLELDARILHLRHYVERRADGKVRVVIRVRTAATAKWGSQGIFSGRYDGRSASAWIPPARSRYQRFAYPDSLFYPSLYGRVLQAALQRAFGAALADLTDRLRAHPARRCVNLFPVKGVVGQASVPGSDPPGS